MAKTSKLNLTTPAPCVMSSSGLNLNVDRSYDPYTGTGGAGGVLRDNCSQWVNGFSAEINVNSSLEAGLASLYYGLVIANQIQAQQLVISTDSRVVIKILDHSINTTDNLVCSCRSLLLNLRNPRIQHEEKSSNRVANKLAKEGLLLPQTLFL